MPRPFTRRQSLQNARFLEALAQTGNARLAAQSLGVHRSTTPSAGPKTQPLPPAGNPPSPQPTPASTSAEAQGRPKKAQNPLILSEAEALAPSAVEGRTSRLSAENRW
jgi:hypothetical protein